MTTARPALLRLEFEDGLDEEDTIARGYRSHVWVELDDGSRYPVTYYDVVRLSQTLDDDARAGRPFFAEPGLIVVPEVTLANMEAAARTLAEEGFFERYVVPERPRSPDRPPDRPPDRLPDRSSDRSGDD